MRTIRSKLRPGHFVRYLSGFGNNHKIGVVLEADRTKNVLVVMTLDDGECHRHFIQTPRGWLPDLERVFSKREVRNHVEACEKSFDTVTQSILIGARQKAENREKDKKRWREKIAKFV